MNDNLKKCMNSLNDNEPRIRSDALQMLLHLCENIVSSPDSVEHRRVRVGDTAILEKLLPAYGAMECLFEMGFIEDGESFALPRQAPLSRLRRVQKELYELQSKLQKAKQADVTPQSSGVRPKIHRKANFLDRVVEDSLHGLKYENTQLQSKACKAMPIERLQIGAMRRMRELQREMKSNSSVAESEITVDDFLLVELLDWFKNEFFSWVDNPDCSVCSKPCKYERSDRSDDPRISRTEIHKCNDCGIEAKFPRYTDPGILLKTRRGRCGEWANAFTLLCRSLGFDARYVHDETDHVWTEVWSISSGRWIHVDPCENVMDRPLIYECGWNKELTYVIAYSRDEVQDVTWRYTRDQSAVMRRRTLCSERDLCLLICRLNEQRQSSPGYSEARRRYVTKRRALELVEMMPAPPGTKKPGEDADTEYGGRTSGSLAWRSLRGETTEKSRDSFVWKIPPDARKFELRYYSAKDEYRTIANSDDIADIKIGWQNGVEVADGGIFRKVETDWKVVYLARSPGQTVGRISWSLEIPKSLIGAVNLVKIRAAHAIFHGATVNWKVTGSCEDSQSNDIILVIENCDDFATDELNGVSRITVSAELAGGDGDLAWQHAQVFRQSLNDKEVCSLSISIETREY